MKKCLISRRSFLKTASTAFAVPFILPSSIWNAKAEEKPNNRLNIGFIGIGMQNRGHLGSVANRNDARVIAVCDVDTDRLNYAKGVVDNRYKERFGENAQKCDAYYDFREMLSRKDLDAVFIATPDHWHSIPVIMAANAGKHIYCEKPLSLTVRQARAMANAVRKNDVIFQTGSQQRSSAEFRKAARMVRNGKIGEIKKIIVNIGAPSRWCDLPSEEAPEGLHWDMWLGPAPYRAYNQKLSPRGVHHFYPWRDYREYSGGMTTDWGCHHYDIVQWALGMDDSGPVKFVPPGNENATSGIKFYYANGVEVQHGGDNTLERDG
ncbi:MAG: Gfo/Idh/MocA family oxidoreductase, partial [Verrucomicrobia bacterium]|nr:Gfo/Idh/MocA family oxidoreductase [Verrucomicrobiota bacterium]